MLRSQKLNRLKEHPHGREQKAACMVFAGKGPGAVDVQLGKIFRDQLHPPWLNIVRRRREACHLEYLSPEDETLVLSGHLTASIPGLQRSSCGAAVRESDTMRRGTIPDHSSRISSRHDPKFAVPAGADVIVVL